MSILQVTTVTTANGTTDSTVTTGNTLGSSIVISANGNGIRFNANSTSTNNFVVNNSGVYLGTSALTNAYIKQAFTGTGACTTFTVSGGYTPNQLEVFVNGIRQEGSEITISSGSTVVFGTAPVNNAVIEVVGYKASIVTTSTANTDAQYTWTNTHTFSNTITYGNTSVNAVVNSTSLVIQGNTTSNVVVSNGAIKINGQGLSVMQGMKNRIINGDMRIYQRAAAVSSNSTSQYSVDRWGTASIDAKGVINVSQSTTVYPNNFVASLHANVTTASASLAPGDFYIINQPIEGVNIADLGWGSSAAKSVTVSFWVYSTITGTYCLSIKNAATRSYVAEYSVPVANTWTQIAVTVPGDTTGTWNSNTSAGLYCTFCLGTGTTYQTTASSWAAGNYFGSSSQVNFMAASGNKFYLTGVQLEAAPIASPFEFRHYGTELTLCQRYYQKFGTVPVTYVNTSAGSYTWYQTMTTRVTMRTTPTGVANFTNISGASGGSISPASSDAFQIQFTYAVGTSTTNCTFAPELIAEL